MQLVEGGRKVSTMVNPDGTVTIRRKVMNPDGSFTLKDELKEEESSFPEKQKSELPTLQLSDSSDTMSSITDMRTLSLMSTTSSKEDVFAGIEESPRGPKETSNPVPFEKSENSASQKEAENENEKNPPLSTRRQVLSSAGAETTKSSPSPVYEWDFKTLRDTGPLIDTRSADGFVEDFHPITVSIFKKQLDDKVGINVGLERIGFRDRLVVTKIAANGLFAESPIQEGDIVASINSYNFLEDPHTEDALAIVSTAVGRITFVVQKRGRTEDVSVPSQPRLRTQEGVGSDGKTVTREFSIGDGSRTLVVDQFDESGKRVHREIRRERMNVDNGRILDTGGDKFSSSSSAGKQTGAVIEKKVVVRKMEKSQKIGLKLETLHTANNKSLFVAGIHPSGLLAKNQTSLILGDIILKINSFDLRENPILEIANSIISNSVGDIAIIASGATQSLTDFADFSRNKVEDDMETGVIANGETKVTAVEFDENSYGGSISSYMSSKVLRLSKADPLESVGFGMMTQITKWGPMLVVSEIYGKVEQSALKVGDAILAINGINFRGKPDPDRAASVLKKATKVVVIEYQRLSQMKSSLSFSGSAAMEKERSRSKSAGESRRSERIEEYDASFRTKVTRSKSVKGGVITSEKNSSPVRLPQSKRSTEPDHQLAPKFIPPKSDTFVVRVAREYLVQEFGISVISVNGILFVSEISLQGLLVGENVLPGDIILSINNMSFHENASAQEAEAQIRDARVLILEVKKQNGAPTSDPHQLKLKWRERLQCKKRSVESL